ncbi:hypothetical protein FDECE_12050 [Fusarium decemcellulare]|nr:hypothetical protein FDECE_12050 [Fusarium decemcellulare]
MHICKTPNGKIEHVVSSEPLPGIESLWHPRRIDVMSLTRIARHKARTTEVEFEDHRVLSKIAIFEWWIPQLEREVKVYESLSRDSSPGKPSIIPTFLGRLMEQERCVGFLMEKVDGRHLTLEDLPACEAALQKLYRAGWVHGEVPQW